MPLCFKAALKSPTVALDVIVKVLLYSVAPDFTE